MSLDYAGAVKSNKSGEKEITVEKCDWKDWNTVPEFDQITNNKEKIENNNSSSNDPLLNSIQIFVEDIISNCQKNNNNSDNNKGQKDSVREISSKFSKILLKCINDAATYAVHDNYKEKPNNSNNDNNDNEIIIKIMKNKVLFRGDKSKYGLILGNKGNTIRNIKSRFQQASIFIPPKNNPSNVITINGTDAIHVLLEIINIMYSQ